jgi:hypothetical protein
VKNPRIDVCTHMGGTNRGEEWGRKGKQEPGREGNRRTARYATSVNPKGREPIDPRMPRLHPA